MKKKPEKSVEEFEKKFHKPVSRDFIEAIKEPHVYADLTEHKNWLTQTLQAERQRCEDAVEAEREKILNILSNLVPREDGVTDVINDWIIPDLKRQITQPNNPK